MIICSENFRNMLSMKKHMTIYFHSLLEITSLQPSSDPPSYSAPYGQRYPGYIPPTPGQEHTALAISTNSIAQDQTGTTAVGTRTVA